MPKRTTHADSGPAAASACPEVRVVLVTLDHHLSATVARAQALLRKDIPGLSLHMHAASCWAHDGQSLQRCLDDIGQAHIVVATMLFMEEHFRPVLAALQSRRADADAMLCMVSERELVRCTRLGRFDMQAGSGGPIALLKRLRGKPDANADKGAAQMKMLRRLPRLLRFVPGTAQDVRAYFLAMQYWLAGSDVNVAQLVRMLVNRYAAGPRQTLRGTLAVEAPRDYPEVGVYHPRMRGRLSLYARALPAGHHGPRGERKGRVGLLMMRSYLLAGNTAHYDAVIAALEARGLDVVPAFASGLDARPAIDTFFSDAKGNATIDAIVSLTGFSLVGGPAYNDTAAAQQVLARLDVPLIAALPLEFQSLEQWRASDTGLTPIESTMMLAIPELDGATVGTVFAGSAVSAEGGGKRARAGDASGANLMQPDDERVDRLASRVDRIVTLRARARSERKLAVVLFCFPPNAGNVGSAAYLGVFESLFNLMVRLRDEGWAIDLPANVDALRAAIVEGNAMQYGTPANLLARIPADDHVRREKHLREIEQAWGPAPGRVQTDGSAIQVLGARFGNLMVGVQPGFGYEGDPMRLLFQKGHAPTHAFSAFYRYVREDFGADVLLHFGTHGALEFMPGKQAGLGAQCWPERLVGDVPNLYLYASNNPSEGIIAKRRSAATLISYLTPPLAHAGLYRGLLDLKESIQRFREAPGNDARLAELIQAQAGALDLCDVATPWGEHAEGAIEALANRVLELEYTLIPDGLHVIGEPLSPSRRAEWLQSLAAARTTGHDDSPAGKEASREARVELDRIDALLADNDELSAIVHALDGGYVSPAPGGDLMRNADVLPTGRNIHGFDPYRMPTTVAMNEGIAQAEQVLERMRSDRLSLPETVALVLWGTDNLKTGGTAVAQAMALIGARPRFDGYGRLAGAELVPLEALGRPRIDVVLTLSGIFRDLLPNQCRMLAQACHLAANADEPVGMNFVRKHSLVAQAEHGVDADTAALRVFTNASGAYGSNVNQLVDSGAWDNGDDLARTWRERKCHAFDHNGVATAQSAQLERLLQHVDAAYQNLDSVELGVTTIDHYFDTLGGISSAAQRARGASIPVYIADHTMAARGTVRSLEEQVALESRTRVLNPKWHEAMLRHGYEGVMQIERHVTNTMGWSATTGQVSPWVYKQLSETFVLDESMRSRMAELNPAAGLNLANRLLEAIDRELWQPDAAMLAALRQATEELEDRLEGIGNEVIA